MCDTFHIQHRHLYSTTCTALKIAITKLASLSFLELPAQNTICQMSAFLLKLELGFHLHLKHHVGWHTLNRKVSERYCNSKLFILMLLIDTLLTPFNFYVNIASRNTLKKNTRICLVSEVHIATTTCLKCTLWGERGRGLPLYRTKLMLFGAIGTWERIGNPGNHKCAYFPSSECHFQVCSWITLSGFSHKPNFTKW